MGKKIGEAIPLPSATTRRRGGTEGLKQGSTVCVVGGDSGELSFECTEGRDDGVSLRLERKLRQPDRRCN